MSSFDETRRLEEKYKPLFIEWYKVYAHDGRFILNDGDDPYSEYLNRMGFDAGLQSVDGKTMFFVDTKVEMNRTGNLFIEEWSNREEQIPGWAVKSSAKMIPYMFVSPEPIDLYEVWLFRLRNPSVINLADYRLVKQSKYDQHNDTWGRIVPIADLLERLVCRRWQYIDGNWVADDWHENLKKMVIY